MEPDSIGKRLKEMRQKRKMSVRTLSKRSGVPQSTLSFIENGRRLGSGLSLETAKRLCWALGVGIGELAGIYEGEANGTDSETLPTALAFAGSAV
jgi:transcriptional regulator with XRE-family HTH domain